MNSLRASITIGLIFYACTSLTLLAKSENEPAKNVVYLGASVPYQSPASLTYFFRTESTNLDITLMVENRLEIEDIYNFRYSLRVNDVVTNLKSGSVDSLALADQLNAFNRYGLFESEIIDVQSLIDSIRSGKRIDLKVVRGMKDPLAQWSLALKSGSAQLIRISEHQENKDVEWIFWGKLYSWEMRRHANGSLVFRLQGTAHQNYMPVVAPINIIIADELQRFESKINQRDQEIFGPDTIKHFGPISSDSTLAMIVKIKQILRSTNI